MSSESVSCVIPTHGRPAFLQAALTSVLAQTRPVDEIVVVSDDDNPQSAEVVLRATEATSVPIRLERNTTRPGASGSRNLGAGMTTSSWIAFLDDDDLWKPDYLENSLTLCQDSDDMVVSWLQMFRDGVEAPGPRIAEALTARDAGGRGHGFIGSNFVIRREAFVKINGFDPDLPVLNDRDFFFRALRAGLKYRVNPRADVLHRRHSSGQLTQLTEHRAAGIERYLDKHVGVLRRKDIRETRMVIHRIRYHASIGRISRLRHLVLGLWNASPRNLWESIATRRTRTIWHG